ANIASSTGSVTGRLAALDALASVAAAGVAAAVAEGEGVAFATFGVEGCAVFVGAPVVQADALKRSDARTSAGDAFKIIFILINTPQVNTGRCANQLT